MRNSLLVYENRLLKGYLLKVTCIKYLLRRVYIYIYMVLVVNVIHVEWQLASSWIKLNQNDIWMLNEILQLLYMMTDHPTNSDINYYLNIWHHIF